MCKCYESQLHNLLAPQVIEKDLGVESLPSSGYWISLQEQGLRPFVGYPMGRTIVVKPFLIVVDTFPRQSRKGLTNVPFPSHPRRQFSIVN